MDCYSDSFWLVNQLATMVSTSIILNGSPSRFFQNSRGLRQGDPISPILFTIMVESLGRNLKRLIEQRPLVGLSPSSTNLICSHQYFVDDTMLMGRSTMNEANFEKKFGRV